MQFGGMHLEVYVAQVSAGIRDFDVISASLIFVNALPSQVVWRLWQVFQVLVSHICRDKVLYNDGYASHMHSSDVPVTCIQDIHVPSLVASSATRSTRLLDADKANLGLCCTNGVASAL